MKLSAKAILKINREKINEKVTGGPLVKSNHEMRHADEHEEHYVTQCD